MSESKSLLFKILVYKCNFLLKFQIKNKYNFFPILVQQLA